MTFIMMGKVTQPKTGPAVHTSLDRNGNPVTKFTIAVYDTFRKESDFFRVVAFGKQAEIADKYIKAGMFLGVRGTVKNNTVKDDQSGKQYYQMSFQVERFTFAPRSRVAMQGEAQEAREREQSQPHEGGGEFGGGPYGF